jgi:hypothetical protein
MTREQFLVMVKNEAAVGGFPRIVGMIEHAMCGKDAFDFDQSIKEFAYSDGWATTLEVVAQAMRER